MTATTHITKAGRAIAEVWRKYRILPGGVFLDDDTPVVELTQDDVLFAGDPEQCQAWIDCEAARAAFESVLPVGDDLLKAMLNAKPSHVLLDESGCEEQFTAAIRAICGRGKC